MRSLAFRLWIAISFVSSRPKALCHCFVKISFVDGQFAYYLVGCGVAYDVIIVITHVQISSAG